MKRGMVEVKQKMPGAHELKDEIYPLLLFCFIINCVYLVELGSDFSQK